MLPGSPSTPAHPTWRRFACFAYLFVGIVVTLAGGLGYALVSVKVGDSAGAPISAAFSALIGLMASFNTPDRTVT